MINALNNDPKFAFPNNRDFDIDHHLKIMKLTNYNIQEMKLNTINASLHAISQVNTISIDNASIHHMSPNIATIGRKLDKNKTAATINEIEARERGVLA